MNISAPFIGRPSALAADSRVALSGCWGFGEGRSPLLKWTSRNLSLRKTARAAELWPLGGDAARAPVWTHRRRTQMTSTSYSARPIILQFDRTDIDGAAREVQAASNAARCELLRTSQQ